MAHNDHVPDLGVANGIATLDAGGKVPASQLPASTSDLSDVLTVGNVTGANDIVVSTGQVVRGVDAATGTALALRGGASSGAGVAGGAVTVTGGRPTDGNGGPVLITAESGFGTNRSGGDITLTVGAPTGTGTAGAIKVNGAIHVNDATGNPDVKLSEGAGSAVLDGATGVWLQTAGITKWRSQFDTFFPHASNAYDIGTATNEIKSIYVGTSILLGTTQDVTIASDGVGTTTLSGGLKVGTTTTPAVGAGDIVVGQNGAPLMVFDSSIGTFYVSNAGGGAAVLIGNARGVSIGSALSYQFASTVNPFSAPDAAFQRAAAGVVAVTNGTTGGGALRVGTYAGAVDAGDFSAGQTGAGTLFLDSSAETLTVTGALGSAVLNASAARSYLELGGSVRLERGFTAGTMGVTDTSGNVPAPVLSRAFSVNAGDADGGLFEINSSAHYFNTGYTAIRTLTLPSTATRGCLFQFTRDNATYAFRIAPQATDHFITPDGAQVDGKYLELTSVGASVLVERLASGDWLVKTSVGGYTIEGANSVISNLVNAGGVVTINTGAATALHLCDAAGNPDVKLLESAGAAVLDGSAGTVFRVAGSNRYWATGAAFVPLAANAYDLGASTNAEWRSIYIGTSILLGTSQDVTIESNGTGTAIISAPGAATAIHLTDAAGNADVKLSEAGGTAALDGALGVYLRRAGANKVFVGATSATPAVANAYDLGAANLPWKDFYVGTSISLGTSQDVTISSDGSGTAIISAPGAATALHLTDASGNADVKLSEVGGGVAALDGALGVYLRRAGSNKVFVAATNFSPTGANNYDLGASSVPWKDLYVGTQILHGTSQSVREQGWQTALTDAAATDILDVTVADGTSVGGTIDVTVHAKDGTNVQSLTCQVFYSAVNKAGTITTQVTALSWISPAVSGGGTLTVTADATTGTGIATIRLTATSSLTTTSLDAHCHIRSLGTQAISPQ